MKTSSLGDPSARDEPSRRSCVGTPERGVDPMRAGALLGSLDRAKIRPTGLPEYLLGRDLVGRGMYAEAAERFDRALAKRLPPGMVLREALRQRVIVACALGDTAAARRAYDIWVDKGEPLAAAARSLEAPARALRRARDHASRAMKAASSAF